jgi:hypothetical protein
MQLLISIVPTVVFAFLFTTIDTIENNNIYTCPELMKPFFEELRHTFIDATIDFYCAYCGFALLFTTIDTIEHSNTNIFELKSSAFDFETVNYLGKFTVLII